MSIFGGGGGGGSSTSGTQTQIAREAPGVEARKLSLYDEAANLAKTKINLPGIQVAPISALDVTYAKHSQEIPPAAATDFLTQISLSSVLFIITTELLLIVFFPLRS